MNWIPESNLVEILEPRKRRMLLKVSLGSIVAIAIVIATTGAIVAIAQYLSIDVDCKQRRRNADKEDLFSYFKIVISQFYISGLHTQSVVSENTDRYPGLEIIRRKSGKTPAMLSIEMPNYLSGVDTWQSFTDEIISKWKDGHLIQLVWAKSESPLGSMDILTSGDDTRWNDLIKNGGQLNKEWKEQLDTLAVYLRQLQTVGVVYILDLLPFMNRKYALWSARRGVNGTVKLYQLTHDYLTKHHCLDSLIWPLSLDKNGGLTNLTDYWPGDEYVDVVVIYLWKNKQLSSIEYQHVVDVAKHKPIAMQGLESIPTSKLLVKAQPRWLWFTIYEPFLVYAIGTELLNINSTFNHLFLVNKNNLFFK